MSESTADRTRVAIACQGGGSHTAFTAGVLGRVFADFPADCELVGVSGTSGGAVCAAAAWDGWLSADRTPGGVLEDVWTDIVARSPTERWLNAVAVWTARMEHAGVPVGAVSPAQNPLAALGQAQLRRVLASNVDFERFEEVAGPDAPTLSVGAVNVTAGEFVTFQDDDVTPDAVLASAAVPDLFEPVVIDGEAHWDGLFSQNPPIRDLMRGPVETVPEELWIVQVNPQRDDEVPRSLRDVYDRRNELAGNISLNQQLHGVERVNEWLDAGWLPEDRFVHTEVSRIQLDERLYFASKLDRDPGFVTDLIAEGEAAAEAFLADR
jgi:NTE family protein